MPAGGGKYDMQLESVLSSCGARQGVLLVLDGKLGEGFSVSASYKNLCTLPDALRTMAAGIEFDVAMMKAKGDLD